MRRIVQPSWLGILLGIAYGLVTRLIFGDQVTKYFLSTMTYGFLVGVPLAVGAITVYFSPKERRASWADALRQSITSGILFLIVVLITHIEVFICILMAAPIFIFVTLLGGTIMWWIMGKFADRHNTTHSLIIIFVLVPYFATPIESRFEPQDSIRTVDTAIVVRADTQTVWQNIVRVRKISDAEQHFALFQLVGIPKPLAATLSFDGVGGVRDATYANGLSFEEVVTDWKPLEKISFTIHLKNPGDTDQPFNQIGGNNFEMLDATYTLEPLADGEILLHLSSRHRLTTNFNTYGGFWTEFILRDIQNYILSIIKVRVETQN